MILDIIEMDYRFSPPFEKLLKTLSVRGSDIPTKTLVFTCPFGNEMNW
jgi:hypothetical protein